MTGRGEPDGTEPPGSTRTYSLVMYGPSRVRHSLFAKSRFAHSLWRHSPPFSRRAIRDLVREEAPSRARRDAARRRRDRRRFAALQHYRTLRTLGLVGTVEEEVERAIDRS